MKMFYNLGARSGHIDRGMLTLSFIQVDQLYVSVACTYKSFMYLQKYACTTRPLDKIA